MDPLTDLVLRARRGDAEACGELVHATQTMVHGVALGVLRDRALAQDAAQQAYVRAFRRLHDLETPAAFTGWLRRISVTVSLNMRRRRRSTLLRLDDVPDVPVLDEAETHWTDAQRHRLAAALLTLAPEDRQLCDRRYHGGWSTARLAAAGGVSETAMRKRMQRIRDRLRKEIEMAEQRGIGPEDLTPDLPARIVELLARPRLTDLPENPVGRTLATLRSTFAGFADRELSEIVNLTEAGQMHAVDAIYVAPHELHRLDEARILRYDLTLPLLLAVTYAGQPMRLWSAGKVYRACQPDATHLEAFHQAEVFWLDDRDVLDPWLLTARVLRSMDALLPGRTMKVVPTEYPMCRQAWELEVEQDGRWYEVLAWGVFTDRIVTHIGADPAKQIAAGIGYGLERLAMLKYGIDDIRKVDVLNVA